MVECNYDGCGISFPNKSQLKRHVQRVHEGIRNNLCEHCFERFFEKSDLKRHIKNVHGQDKPWKCERCPCEYSRKDSLKVHMYSRHKAFRCSRGMCSYSCHKKSTLYLHVESTHEGNWLFECCQTEFYSKHALYSHFERVH